MLEDTNEGQKLYIECDCSIDDHRIVITKYTKDKEVYFHYFLDAPSFKQRVILAFKYIFGFKSKFGHFGESIWTEKQIKQIRAFLKDMDSEE